MEKNEKYQSLDKSFIFVIRIHSFVNPIYEVLSDD